MPALSILGPTAPVWAVDPNFPSFIASFSILCPNEGLEIDEFRLTPGIVGGTESATTGGGAFFEITGDAITSEFQETAVGGVTENLGVAVCTPPRLNAALSYEIVLHPSPGYPNAPLDVIIPVDVTIAGSGRVSVDGPEFQIGFGSGSASSQIDIVTPSGSGNVRGEAIVGCGFNQCIDRDLFSQMHNFYVHVETGWLRFLHESKATGGGTAHFEANTDPPIIEIDSTFMVEVDGDPALAKDAYTIVYSPGVFLVPEPDALQLQLSALAVLFALGSGRRAFRQTQSSAAA